MTASPRSVLVISASPDDRRSTESLRTAVSEMRRRGVRTTVWFLRCWPPEVAWDGSRVVDTLRTWAATDLLARAGLLRPAGWLRGWKLRRWLKEVSPDVVLLDDGLGERVVAPLGDAPVRIVRHNEHPPLVDFDEPVASDADLLIVPAHSPVDGSDQHVLPMGMLKDLSRGRTMRDRSSRDALLESLSVPTDSPVVLGWGDDGWIDGPDLFIRAMWTLAARGGREPTAVWLDFSDDPYSVERLRAEALRCGLAERFVLCIDPPEAAKWCGDVTFLPARAAAAGDDMALALAAGSQVVTFDVNSHGDLPLTTVGDLDLEAAAAEIARAIDRGPFLEPLPIDASVWVDRLFGVISERRQA